MLMQITMRNPHVYISSFLFLIFNLSFLFFSIKYINLLSKWWDFSQLFSNPAWSSSNARATQSVGGGSIQTTQSHSSGSYRINLTLYNKKLANNVSKMRGQTEWEWELILHLGGSLRIFFPCLHLPRRRDERGWDRALRTAASCSSPAQRMTDGGGRTQIETEQSQHHRPKRRKSLI